MSNTQTPTYPALTKKEARYLTELAQAAQNYEDALSSLKGSIEREEALLAAGHNTYGISNQGLIEAATMQAKLKTLAETGWYAYDMTDHEAWKACVELAYNRKVRWFHYEGE